MKTLLELVNRYTNNELEEIEPLVGDRGMSNIDVEIFLNVWDRAFADPDTVIDMEKDDRETTCWVNVQKTLNY